MDPAVLALALALAVATEFVPSKQVSVDQERLFAAMHAERKSDVVAYSYRIE